MLPYGSWLLNHTIVNARDALHTPTCLRSYSQSVVSSSGGRRALSDALVVRIALDI